MEYNIYTTEAWSQVGDFEEVRDNFEEKFSDDGEFVGWVTDNKEIYEWFLLVAKSLEYLEKFTINSDNINTLEDYIDLAKSYGMEV